MQTSATTQQATLKSFMSLIITDRKHFCSADSILLPNVYFKVSSFQCIREAPTLFSMYSSHCSPRLVTMRGVPSSTGRMSILNF